MTQTATEQTGQARGEYETGPLPPVEEQVARSLRFAHLMTQAIERQAHETVRLVEGLNQLLAAKGIFGPPPPPGQ